ncbi:lipase [Multifurca ochricompacta]|uniref:Lipase n=1 Tax=Multifurca ochricompacta TaxID=376703 RepID=A0AAD4M2K7_9AGAM|nr:lipase [Multifurca ochricompacta]
MLPYTFSTLCFAAVLTGIASAASVNKRQTITPLSSSQVSAFKPYSYFAATTYCPPSQTLQWNCGANCAANPDFKPVASGGDGNAIQYWYVGFSPSLNTVIVAHQGTNTSQILADLTDLNLILGPLDSNLFPGVPSDVLVHSGFAQEHAKTAETILANIKDALTKYSATSVTSVGHSLGAALALLESVYLPLHLPSGITFKTVTYGLPRVGNQAFADYVDQHDASLTHINNKEDPIPTVPWQFLGYRHPSGQVHIQDSGVWVACPGQENPSSQCTDGDVSLFRNNEADHDGPYDGVELKC